jgi:hypothetical protein
MEKVLVKILMFNKFLPYCSQLTLFTYLNKNLQCIKCLVDSLTTKISQ